MNRKLNAFWVAGLMVTTVSMAQLAPQVGGTEPEPENVQSPEYLDEDRNRIRDDFDSDLANASEDDHFRIIAQLLVPVENDTMPQLLEALGDFAVHNTWTPSGFSANMAKSQILALAERSDVKMVEPALAHVAFDMLTARAATGVNIAFDPGILNVTGSLDGDLHGYTENDIVVCLVDTGINVTHPAFTANATTGYNRTIPGERPYTGWWKDITAEARPEPFDSSGHGSSMASIIVGHDLYTYVNPPYAKDNDPPGSVEPHRGVAPGAALAVARGAIVGAGATEIDTLIQALKWCAGDYHPTPGSPAEGPTKVDIISTSWGVDTFKDCAVHNDGLNQTLTDVTNLGIVVVVSTSNDGPKECTMNENALLDKVITIGMSSDPGNPPCSVGSLPEPASWPGGGWFLDSGSGRGNSATLKPDFLAPGVCINAARVLTPTSGPDVEPYYSAGTGSSPATAFTAGVIALMMAITGHKGRHTDSVGLNTSDVRSIFQNTTLGDWGKLGRDYDFGSGEINARAAIVESCKRFFVNTSWPTNCKVNATTGQGIGSNVDPPQPTHSARTQSLGTGTTVDKWKLNVTNTSWSISITMIMANWVSLQDDPTHYLDFNLNITDPPGQGHYASNTTSRQDTISIPNPLQTGNYTISVINNGALGVGGTYWLDVSAGGTLEAAPFQDQ